MKRSTLYFQIVITACLCFSNPASSENLVLNAGFENFENKPTHWVLTGPVASMIPMISFDHLHSFNGVSALKMESNNVNGHGRAVQVVQVTGDLTYSFSARFMTKEVASIDKSVMIRIKWLRGDENIGYHYIVNIEGESKGWSLAADKIKALPGATAAEISLEFRWSTGTVWWDDIGLEVCADIPPRNVKVGTVYCRPPGPTVEKNIAVMSGLLDQAGQAGCQMICLPEGWPTNNTGIGMQKHEVNTIEGSASQMMAVKAKQYGMYIISGLYSWIGDTLNNVAALYNPQGSIQAIYKKVQLPDSEAESGAVPGNELPVFTTDFGTIGILICWDYAFPEVARAMALKGAEIIFCPIAGDVRGPDMWKVISRSRAVDNAVYFVNSIYDGHSMIINPAGDVLQETGTQNSLIMATIDLNFSPPWDWVGNAGRGDWKGVWRKDRRGDIFGGIGVVLASGGGSVLKNR